MNIYNLRKMVLACGLHFSLNQFYSPVSHVYIKLLIGFTQTVYYSYIVRE